MVPLGYEPEGVPSPATWPVPVPTPSLIFSDNIFSFCPDSIAFGFIQRSKKHMPFHYQRHLKRNRHYGRRSKGHFVEYVIDQGGPRLTKVRGINWKKRS